MALITPPFVQELDSDPLQMFMGAKNNGHAIGTVVGSHRCQISCYQIPQAIEVPNMHIPRLIFQFGSLSHEGFIYKLYNVNFW